MKSALTFLTATNDVFQKINGDSLYRGQVNSSIDRAEVEAFTFC